MTDGPTWEGALERLAGLLGSRSAPYRVEAEEWLREAVRETYGVESLHDLDRTQRQVALQRLVLVVDSLAGEGEIAFDVGQRSLVAATFSRLFECEPLTGPPWRVSPFENRESYEDANTPTF